MERLHARYPFLDAARAAVAESEDDLAAIAGDDAIVDRAIERVEGTVADGHVGAPARSTRVELLSYPLARVLVSLVEDPALVRAYATAEARTAVDRLRDDVEGDRLRSSPYDPPDLGRFLATFGLDDAIQPDREVPSDRIGSAGSRDDDRKPGDRRPIHEHTGLTASGEPADRFLIDVTAYLRHVPDQGDDWRLVARELDAGRVTIDRDELYRILEGAIRDRVMADLPLSVPSAVADRLADPLDRVREALGAVAVPGGVETVRPEAFPPCVDALLERAERGDDLPHHSEFSLVGFLAAIGADEETILDRCARAGSMDEESVRRRIERVRDPEAGDPIVFAPPSCATMQALGDCVNMDARCETIAHPLAYYESALAERGATDGGAGDPDAERPSDAADDDAAEA